METRKDAMKDLQWKLEMTTRGHAQNVLNPTHYYTDEQKIEEMKAVEEWVTYIRDYNKNMEIIKKYKELQELQHNLIDDGR